MFKMHGYSGPCPKPPLQSQPAQPQGDAMSRANERRDLRERLICAALTGIVGRNLGSDGWYAERAISHADAVLAALDKEAAK